MAIKPIETHYNGYRFRSRLEARWAVFFDAMGIRYEYEPEGFELEYGIRYLPDFILLNVRRRHCPSEKVAPIYVEVKGTDKYSDICVDDKVKIEAFAKHYPLLVIGNIPQNSWDVMGKHWDVGLFSYEYLDGDNYPCFFFMHNGEPWIAGPDHDECDLTELTDKALAIARQARFERGETPPVKTPQRISPVVKKPIVPPPPRHDEIPEELMRVYRNTCRISFTEDEMRKREQLNFAYHHCDNCGAAIKGTYWRINHSKCYCDDCVPESTKMGYEQVCKLLSASLVRYN